MFNLRKKKSLNPDQKTTSCFCSSFRCAIPPSLGRHGDEYDYVNGGGAGNGDFLREARAKMDEVDGEEEGNADKRRRREEEGRFVERKAEEEGEDGEVSTSSLLTPRNILVR